jgi:hypothetical protein
MDSCALLCLPYVGLTGKRRTAMRFCARIRGTAFLGLHSMFMRSVERVGDKPDHVARLGAFQRSDI